MRFVRNTPAIQHAMIRTIAFSIPASAPWALLPLYVRRDLLLGPGMYGVILGMMGVGGVTSGMLLPMVRGKLSRGATVVTCSLFSCAGMAFVGLADSWAPAAFGMLLFGIGWTSAYATIQAAAQLVCPSWVRARSLSIYQLAQNGALTLGSFGWGWVGGTIGLHRTFMVAAAVGLILTILARYARIESITVVPLPPEAEPVRGPEAPAAELMGLLRNTRGRVMETVHYRVDPEQRAEFLALMHEARFIRGRSGALFWQVYEDVAHPEGWLEVWSMENWTDHLREATRLSDDDKQLLARLSAFQVATERPQRYLAVDPHTGQGAAIRAHA
jgi:MFS family permease